MCVCVAGGCDFSQQPDRVFLISCNTVFLIRPGFLLKDFFLCFVLLVCRVVDYQGVAMDLTLISF